VSTFSKVALRLIVVGGVAGLMIAAAPAQTTRAEYATSLVSQSQYQNVHSNYLYTHNGNNRGNGAQHDLARTNIKNFFESFGLTTTLEAFSYGGTYYNVIGEHLGTTYPTRIYIIGAHFDSVNNPGADDNASGVAGVIEAARLISQWPSDSTIRFIAFDREEQGLIGSTAYASAHHTNDIRGMVSLDMIAYRGTGGNKNRTYGYSGGNALKQALSNASTWYGGLTMTIGGEFDASDHAPFEDYGFQACCLIEYRWDSNPYYHTQQDSVDTANYIDYAFAIQNTKAIVGWLVDAAGVTPAHPAGDMNCDYAVDGFDIDPFFVALASPEIYGQLYPSCNFLLGDVNGDGYLDGFDIDPFFVLLAG
jgi:Zn-dependent M28 family amino/carboxypeptidase